MPEFTGISHLELSVTDAEKSAGWYAEVLGLKRLRRSESADYVVEMLLHPPTGMVVGLLQHNTPTADQFDERRPGLDHVGFAVTERAELDMWQQRLADLGVPHSPITDSPSGSGTALVFRDPDNIQLELWWTRPRNR